MLGALADVSVLVPGNQVLIAGVVIKLLSLNLVQPWTGTATSQATLVTRQSISADGLAGHLSCGVSHLGQLEFVRPCIHVVNSQRDKHFLYHFIAMPLYRHGSVFIILAPQIIRKLIIESHSFPAPSRQRSVHGSAINANVAPTHFLLRFRHFLQIARHHILESGDGYQRNLGVVKVAESRTTSTHDW